MEIQRTITLILDSDLDMQRTLEAFQQVQQRVSDRGYNGGSPLGAVALQRACYHDVSGVLNSQMTISAIRLVAGAYGSAKRNHRPVTHPLVFRHKHALFLIGRRGRDADFRADGTLSIWTVGGRKRLGYSLPEHFKPIMAAAKELDCLTVIERRGRLIGRLTVTLDAPNPQGITPVGIDLNETNAIVAVDAANRLFFVSGKATKVRNRRTQKTRKRLQAKHAARKAEHKDSRSVRRVLKRLGRAQSNRTRTFIQTAAKQLVMWAPSDAVLVFEDLHIPPVSKKAPLHKGTRRRLTQWPHGLVRRCVQHKAEERGLLLSYVNAAYTSQRCARCGQQGQRKRHSFFCAYCNHKDHADINAAVNIRNRYTVLRHGGPPSTGPEALSVRR